MKFIRPKKYAEANVQGEFYHQCKMLGLRFCLEYRYENCIFDAVMINDNDDIYAIVEFKREKNYAYTGRYKGKLTKQLTKYSRYGIPVLVCVGYAGLSATLDKILELKKANVLTNIEIFK